MNARKLRAYRRIGTTTLAVHLVLMGLAGIGNDPAMFLAALVGAGFAGYTRIYFKEELQAMTDTEDHSIGYRDLAMRLRWEIRNEKNFTDADGKLPTHRELATRFGTTRTTVRRALQVLVKDSQVVIIHGHGTYLTSDDHPANPSTGYGTRAAMIETHILKNIALGLPVEPAPSLALTWSVSGGTVRKVINKLVMQGVIKTTKGGGFEKA